MRQGTRTRVASGLAVSILALASPARSEAPPPNGPVEDDLLARFPRRGANAAALALEALAADLGFDVVPGTLAGAPFRGGPLPRRGTNVTRLLSDHFRGLLRDPTPAAIPPGDALACYLDERAAVIDAVRRLLLDGETPRWEVDLERLQRAPLPSPRVFHLQRLLLADALRRGRGGDPTGALDSFEAASRLEEALRERPEIHSQILALVMARTAAVVLRKLERVPAAWIDRLEAHDYRASVQTAIRHEVWLFDRLAERDALDVREVLGIVHQARAASLDEWVAQKAQEAAFTNPASRSYFRKSLRDTAARAREAAAALEAIEPCEIRGERFTRELEAGLPWWNTLGALLLSNYGNLWERVGDLLLDRETTRRALALRAERERTGAWPASLPGIERSDCPESRWVYHAFPDGGMALTLVHSRVRKLPHYPPLLDFRSEPPAGPPLEGAAQRAEIPPR
jgi:hypothetical protein